MWQLVTGIFIPVIEALFKLAAVWLMVYIVVYVALRWSTGI